MALYDPVNMWSNGPRSGARRPATATSGLGVMNGGSLAQPMTGGVGTSAGAPQSAPMPQSGQGGIEQMLQQLMMLMQQGGQGPMGQPQPMPMHPAQQNYLNSLYNQGMVQDALQGGGTNITDIVRGVGQHPQPQMPQQPGLQGMADYLANLGGMQGQQPNMASNFLDALHNQNFQGPEWMRPFMNTVTGAQQPNMAQQMADSLYNNRPNDALASSGMSIQDIVRGVANRPQGPPPVPQWAGAAGHGLQGLPGSPGAHPGMMGLMAANNQMGGWHPPTRAPMGAIGGVGGMFPRGAVPSNFSGGGEGGAMGAPAAFGEEALAQRAAFVPTPAAPVAPLAAPAMGQRSVAQMGGEGGAQGGVGTSSPAPQSAPVPTPAPAAPTTPPRFARNDIDFMALQALGPDLAAAMGFGPGAKTSFGQTFWDFSHQGGRSDTPEGNVDPRVMDYYGWNVSPPKDFNSQDFYDFFLSPEVNLSNLYSDPLGQSGSTLPLHRNDRIKAMQTLYEYIANAERGLVPSHEGQQPTVDPNAPPPVTGPGDYGETEREAFRRPWSPGEQQYFDFGNAAMTGRNPVDPNVQANIQAAIDADLKAGRLPDIQAITRRVSQAQHSNPGVQIYNASMGITDPGELQAIREQASTNMGNIGMRFSTDADKAIAGAVHNLVQGHKDEAQNQLMQIQSNIAAMQGLREQSAQSALYDQFIRSLGMPEGWNSLMELLRANIGGTTSNTGSAGGSPGLLAAGSGLQGLAGLAGAYANSNPYSGQIPTLQGSTGPQTYNPYTGHNEDVYGGQYTYPR